MMDPAVASAFPSSPVAEASLRAEFARFLEARHATGLRALLASRAGAGAHHGLAVSAAELLDAAPALGALLIGAARLVLPLLDEGLREAQGAALRVALEGGGGVGLELKPLCHVRIAELPCVEELCLKNVSAIRASDVDKFMQACVRLSSQAGMHARASGDPTVRARRCRAP